MNLYDAYVLLLEATVEQDGDPEIRKARKRVAKKVEAIRLKRERRPTPQSALRIHHSAFET